MDKYIFDCPGIFSYLNGVGDLLNETIAYWLHYSLLGYGETKIYGKLEDDLACLGVEAEAFEEMCDEVTTVMALIPHDHKAYSDSYYRLVMDYERSGSEAVPSLCVLDPNTLCLSVEGIPDEERIEAARDRYCGREQFVPAIRQIRCYGEPRRPRQFLGVQGTSAPFC